MHQGVVRKRTLRRLHLRLIFPCSLKPIAYGLLFSFFETQRSRRTLFDRLPERLDIRSVNIDPRLLIDIEDLRQSLHAFPGVDTNVFIVTNGDFVVAEFLHSHLLIDSLIHRAIRSLRSSTPRALT